MAQDYEERSAQQIIRFALQALGRIASGDRIAPNIQQDGFDMLNMMIDRWRTQRLVVPMLSRLTYALDPDTGSYTIGPGGTIDTPRLMTLESAAILENEGTDQEYERRLGVWDEQLWATTPLKAQTAETVTGVYFDPMEVARWGRVYIAPVPTVAKTLVLYGKVGMRGFPNLTTKQILYPGYATALYSNLAVELGPMNGLEPSRSLFATAAMSLADIKRPNIRHRILGHPTAVGGQYNIYTDESR